LIICHTINIIEWNIFVVDGCVKFYAHCRTTVEGLAKFAGITEEEMRGHLAYMPELLDLLARSQEYVPDYVRIFFATL
jgi:hypothetical protein